MSEKLRAVLSVWLGALLLVAGAAVAQQTPKNLPMLDTGGHMGVITELIFTPDGAHLISASDDKTIRVWNIENAGIVRTIRGESGRGSVGRIYAAALSPNGKLLATGGFFCPPERFRTKECDEPVRIFDLDSGKLLARLPAHRGAITSVAFSSDGKKLASADDRGIAIIWNVSPLLFQKQSNYTAARAEMLAHKQPLNGHKKGIYAIRFLPSGDAVVTASDDRKLKLWRIGDGKELSVMTGHSERIWSLAVAPNGLIASGDWNGEIRIWNSKSDKLKLLRSLSQFQTPIFNLSFSPGGKSILVGTSGENGAASYVFDVFTGKETSRYSGITNDVYSTAISPDGSIAASAGGNNAEIHLWNFRTGKSLRTTNGNDIKLGGTGSTIWSVGFSNTKNAISWGTLLERYDPNMGHGSFQHSIEFNNIKILPTPISVSFKDEDKYSSSRSHYNRYSLRHEENEYGLNSVLKVYRYNEIVSEPIIRTERNGYHHIAYTFSADGQTIISAGSDGWLTAYDTKGTTLGEFEGHTGDVLTVASSSSGRYLVSGSEDQTVRLWNLKTRELLVTLFHGTDGEWVMWTPEGFFIASENGGNLVGWQINQGADKEARYVAAEQVRKLFYRPDLVTAKIEGGADNERLLREEAERLDIDAILTSGRAPEVAILSPGDGWEANDNKANVTIRITGREGGIGRIEFRVNGQRRGAAFGSGVLNERGEITREFELGQTSNVIEVIAYNEPGFIASEPVRVTVRVDEQTLKGVPDLYVLAVGVNEYFDSNLALHYAVADATRLSEVLKAAAVSQGGKEFYRSVVVEILPDEKVTRENVAGAFARMGERMRATDVFVFFIAGHGKTVGGNYYFLPPGFRNFGKEPIITQGFGPDEWEEWTARITAEKSLLIYDTCEAGSQGMAGDTFSALFRKRGAEQIAAYERLKERTGRMTLMATSDSTIALEGYRNKHGILTYAILEALAIADHDGDGEIALTELVNHVGKRVPDISCELTKPGPASGEVCYRQVPQASFIGSPFSIAPKYAAAHPDPGAADAVPHTAVIGQPAPREKTHFVREPTALLQAVGGAAINELPKHYGVTVVKISGEFILIARDGKTIGYVQKDKLSKIE